MRGPAARAILTIVCDPEELEDHTQAQLADAVAVVYDSLQCSPSTACRRPARNY